MKGYCSLLCRHPYAVVCTVATLITACLVVALTLRQLPAFNDPALGFEARGTTVSNRAAAWRAMLEATRPSGPLTVNPAQQQKGVGPWPHHHQHPHDPVARRGRPRPRGRGSKNRTAAHRLKHTHMVCVEAVGGDISVQPNCSSEDLQQLHQMHLNSDSDETNDIFYPDDHDDHGDESNAESREEEYRRSNRSVAAVGTGDGVAQAATQRSPLDKLRLLGLEHDHRHTNDNVDYFIDHEPLYNYDVQDDYEGEEDEEEGEHDHVHTAPDRFFCNALVPDYGHVVVSMQDAECPPRHSFTSPFSFSPTVRDDPAPPIAVAVNGTADGGQDEEGSAAASLLTLEHLLSLCALDQRIRRAPSFSSICQLSSPGVCCPSWSVPNYVALLSNRTHCSHITEENVLYLRGLLHSCGRHFDLSLQGGCGRRCSSLPPACMEHDAVYTILHYLADVHFMAQQEVPAPRGVGVAAAWWAMRTSALFLPVARSSDTLPFYEQLASMDLTEGNVTVISMELGVKNALFDKLLVADAVLVIGAGAAVLVLVFMYTTSILLTLITIATVASSLLLAYCLYTFVLGIAFFPYMNVLTCIIAVGLGADDTFVFVRVWRTVVSERRATVLADGAADEGGVTVDLVQEVMNHAVSSVVVTSLTTAAAFLASTTSAITAIKCFSLFAGSVVLANLVLMLTWVPACLVIAERWRLCCPLWSGNSSSAYTTATTFSGPASKSSTAATAHHHNPAFTSTAHRALAPTSSSSPAIVVSNNNTGASIIPLDNNHAAVSTTHQSPPISPPHSASNSPCSPNSLHSSHSISQSPPRSPHIPIQMPSSPVKPSSNCCVRMAHKVTAVSTTAHHSFFDSFMPWLVIKPRLLWVVLLTGITVYSCVLVFYYPRMRLPDSADFQLFNRDHYFERYDLDHKYNFWFERNLRSDIVNRLPIRIVWGFKPVDNGDHLNPASESTLEFDPTFDLSAPESQSWLLRFCQDLRKQDFYMSTLGPLLPNCFIETFKSWMEERRCADPRQNRYPCCEMMRFPYPRWVFNKCITEAVEVLYQTPRLYFVPGVAGPKFNKSTNKVAALVVEYDSTAIWSLSFDQMHHFFTQVEDWSSKQLSEAPSGLRGGWFTSYLEFYEVQRSLLEGTQLAVLVAVVVSLVVLMLTTLNVVVSIVAVMSVASIMIVTLAALVVLGWRLNVLESIVVTAAIGLAVDLTLHYAVAYTKAPKGKRLAAVTWALTRLGSPVLMSTLTTLAAAVTMLPATVLAYIHVASFLIIIAVTSFIYSTFFFLPLMSLVGPEDSCGDLMSQAACSEFCQCRDNEHDDKRVYQQACASESTLSTSSVCPSAHCSGHNSHEWDGTYIGLLNNLKHELEPLTSTATGSGEAGATSVGFSQLATSKTPPKHDIAARHCSKKNHQKQQIGGCGSCNSIEHRHHHKSRDGQCPQHSSSSPCHQSLGLIVSIQQNRRQSRQQQKQQQQNGSCAQLVVRKESTESQASVVGDVGCVCRSSSVGSRPSHSSATASSDQPTTGDGKEGKQQRSASSKQPRGGRKHVVSKQDSSPHLTPANSVSTLVCSEPDNELEELTFPDRIGPQPESRVCLPQLQQMRPQQPDAEEQQQMPTAANYQQQQRQKLFIQQHNQEQQHYFAADAKASAAMV